MSARRYQRRELLLLPLTLLGWCALLIALLWRALLLWGALLLPFGWALLLLRRALLLGAWFVVLPLLLLWRLPLSVLWGRLSTVVIVIRLLLLAAGLNEWRLLLLVGWGSGANFVGFGFCVGRRVFARWWVGGSGGQGAVFFGFVGFFVAAAPFLFVQLWEL